MHLVGSSVNKSVTTVAVEYCRYQALKKGMRKDVGVARSPDANNPYLGWDGLLLVEREQLAQRCDGKMARMIGRALPGESQEYLEMIASDDQYMAQQGYVLLRNGDRIWHKHIDELTPQDRPARVEYEKTLVLWLRGRIEAEKIAAQWRKQAQG